VLRDKWKREEYEWLWEIAHGGIEKIEWEGRGS
jgi:hypothetical protein